MNIFPKTNIISGMRANSLPWWLILGELIDNALDANARHIKIEFTTTGSGKRSLVVADDGDGCDDLSVFFALGDHQEHAKDPKNITLGRYGVGAKYAAVNSADGFAVESIKREKGGKNYFRACQCSWTALEKSNEWRIEDPIVRETDRSCGTRITLSPLRMKFPTDYDRLIRKLGLVYWPALKKGAELQIKKHSAKQNQFVDIKPYELPSYIEDKSSKTFEIDGKVAQVTMGLYPDGYQVKETGLYVAHGFRVIQEEQRYGLGDKPTPRLVGWVNLLKGWVLSKHKDSVTDASLDKLEEMISLEFKEVIEKAASQAKNVTFSKVAKIFNDIFKDSGNAGTGKAKRSPKCNNTGTISAKGSDKRHTTARIIQPGNTFPVREKELSKSIQIAYSNFGKECGAIRVQGNIITFNTDIEVLKNAEHNERELICHTVWALSSYFAITKREFPLFPACESDVDRMSQIVGHLMNCVETNGSKPAIKIAQ